VPEDFQTIQEAINNASISDTILVANGTYNEHLTINKSITIMGASNNQTILNGTIANTAVTIIADNVTIKGFTIQGFYTGIVINQSQGISIVQNQITKTWTKGAVYLINSRNITLTNNTINRNQSPGIYAFNSNTTKFSQNNITNNDGIGISLNNCTNTVIIGNKMKSNLGDAIFCAYAYDLRIEENILTLNDYRGVWASNSNGTVFHNNFITNRENAKAVLSSFTWDNGYPSGGNYWSNYTGADTDDDGIGDTPQILDANNQDNYPFMRPFILGDGNHDGVVNIKDVAQIALHWLQMVPPAPANFDFNADGIINKEDANIISANWQKRA
jgi:parallel beta-helix repeat protein